MNTCFSNHVGIHCRSPLYSLNAATFKRRFGTFGVLFVSLFFFAAGYSLMQTLSASVPVCLSYRIAHTLLHTLSTNELIEVI